MHRSPSAISTASFSVASPKSNPDRTPAAGAQSTATSPTAGCHRRRHQQPCRLSVPGSLQTTPCDSSNNIRGPCRQNARRPARYRPSARNAGSSRGVHESSGEMRLRSGLRVRCARLHLQNAAARIYTPRRFIASTTPAEEISRCPVPGPQYLVPRPYISATITQTRPTI
jgi:hypothetical protein